VNQPQAWYADFDGDGVGDSQDMQMSCTQPSNYVLTSGDTCPGDYGTNNGCPDNLENYIFTRSYQEPLDNANQISSSDQVIESRTYYDGIGRPVQQIAIEAVLSTPRLNVQSNVSEWTVDWTVGSGSTAFYNQNGQTSENSRINGLNPFGETSLIWECGNDADNNADGGWNTDYFNVDINASYRYSVWVKRTHSQNGRTYHGTQNVNYLSGSANNNPYFWNGDLPQLEEWYLMVGVVHPHTYSGGDTEVSGIYDIYGNKVLDGQEFKWRPDTTTSRFRSYLYYATDVNVRQYFYGPVLEKLDGTESSLENFFETEQIPLDLVTPIKYDAYGRQAKEYLPYPDASPKGYYRTDAITESENYYLNSYPGELSFSTPNPYSEKVFEASPINRVLAQAAPGESWVSGSGHEIRFDYQTNSDTDIEPVVHFEVTTALSGDKYVSTLSKLGTYSEGELYKTITKDENWQSGLDHTTEEFTDKQGRVVLKRTYNQDIPHDTYYVYDEYGNLSYVIPPKVDTANGVDSTELSELCYQYMYDTRNRLIEKKIPGKGWEYIVYNKLDQPIMTQDALLQSDNKWLVTKYDAFGRVAFTGFTNGGARGAVQSAADAITGALWVEDSGADNVGGTTLYYSDGGYPANSAISELLTINYYDGYNPARDGLTLPTGPVLGQTLTSNVKGLPTVSKVKVLGTTDWITSLTGYDQKGRGIYMAQENPYLNTTDITETKLDFTGKVLESRTNHTKDSNAAIVTLDQFEYDPMGRLLVHNQTIDGLTTTIASNTYDQTGQLVLKSVGGIAQSSPLNLVDLVNVSVSGSVVTSTNTTNGWNNGFASDDFITGDGFVEWRVADTGMNIMVGLSKDNPNANYNTIDYALYQRSDNSIRVHENQTLKGTFGTYVPGDILRVERLGTTVRYLHNGVVIYTSSVQSTQPLQVDASMYHVGSSIEDLRFEGESIDASHTPLQVVDYDYNIRGWLKTINNVSNIGTDLFAFGINYNDPTNFGANENPTPLYNGNISQVQWNSASVNTSGNPVSERYSYEYDPLNRIIAATDNTNNYNVSNIGYDKNGNIQSLTRNGYQNSSTFTNMDVLDYDYDNGNKLTKVTDGGNDAHGFKDGTNTNTDFEYDINGNLEIDRNKGITSIAYNHLNLPEQVNFGSDNIKYVYDATGAKLKRTSSTGTETLYSGNFIYEGGIGISELQFFSHPEGYVTPDGQGGYEYVYNYVDHLGSVRLSYTDADNDGNIDPDNEIIEDNAYYPFGLLIRSATSSVSPYGNSAAKRWKFNGQELDESLGINLYEMELRRYDPTIARWTSIDPIVHHSMSTYTAFDNNPVFWADPSGADSWSYIGNGVYRNNQSNEETNDYQRAISETQAHFGETDCPDCDNPNILFDAISKIGEARGRDNAASYIKQWEEGFSASEAEKLPLYQGGGDEQITGDKLPKYEKASTGFKGFLERIVKTLGGDKNIYKFSNSVEVADGSVNYYGEIRILANSNEMIVAESTFPESGVVPSTDVERHGITFRNRNGKVVSTIFFQSQSDMSKVWNYYYERTRVSTIKNVVKAYDKSNNTKIYSKMFKE
jgi:RHS repeat-associated protein